MFALVSEESEALPDSATKQTYRVRWLAHRGRAGGDALGSRGQC